MEYLILDTDTELYNIMGTDFLLHYLYLLWIKCDSFTISAHF